MILLAGITLAGGFAVLAELLGRVADRTGITDKLFKLFGLPAEKESAPTVGAAEAEKENTSIPSIQGDGEKVKNRLVVEELESVTSYSSEIKAMGAEGLARLYAATQTAFVDAAKESGIPFDFLEFVAKKIGSTSKVGRADR